MAEAKAKKVAAEVTQVQMEDGRTVAFAGKRKVLKETLIDESKILVDGDTVTLSDGAVCIRMDFLNGTTRTFPLRTDMIARYAGHGGEQKFGDELAAPAANPLSPEDMVLAVDELHEQVNVRGEWRQVSEGGGGFSGASTVVLAIAEASGKSVPEVKAFLQKKLDAAKERNEKLSRKELYDSFRNPNSKVGQIIKRMDDEKLSKANKVDADAELAALSAE